MGREPPVATQVHSATRAACFPERGHNAGRRPSVGTEEATRENERADLMTALARCPQEFMATLSEYGDAVDPPGDAAGLRGDQVRSSARRRLGSCPVTLIATCGG